MAARAARTRGTTARLDLAHALTDGPDGGVLQSLVTAVSDETVDPSLRRTAAILLAPADLGEFELRGEAQAVGASGRGLYCVSRPGWRLDGQLVVRPLLEPVAA